METIKVELTEEQIQAAAAELRRREKARNDAYAEEYHREQKAAEERFWAGMLAQYPDLDRDTMYDIYHEIRNFYE